MVELLPLSDGNALNRRNRIGVDSLRERLAIACVDAQQTARFPLTGPQKRGTGGTLNLIKFRMRPGSAATIIKRLKSVLDGLYEKYY